MAATFELFLVNPDPEMCAARRTQFDQLANVTVIEGIFEDLADTAHGHRPDQ